MRERIDKSALIYKIFVVMFFGISLLLLKVIIPKYFSKYDNMAILIVWIGNALVASKLKVQYAVYKSKEDKLKTTLIIVTVCYMFYFFIGIFAGYTYNPYSQNLITIIKNVIYFVGTIIIREYVRNKLIRNNREGILGLIVITSIMIILQINFTELMKLSNQNDLLFEYTCSTVLPIIAANILCTYLSKLGGLTLNYSYIIPVALIQYLLPIFPNVDWFVTTAAKLLVIIIIIIYNNFETKMEKERLGKSERKKEDPTTLIPYIFLLVFLVMFIAGLFPYRPVAVMSNSMVPTFARGSVVITKKINNKFQELKIGDILEYKTENGTVIHRIVEINESPDGEFTFVTKGDANNSNDNILVTEEQAIATVKLSIPYIGYPSVMVAELFFGKQTFIVIE